MTPMRLTALALLATTAAASAMDVVTDTPLNLDPGAETASAADATPWWLEPIATVSEGGPAETDVAPALVLADAVEARVPWAVVAVAEAGPVQAEEAPLVETAAAAAADIMTEMADADPTLEVTHGADGEVDGMVMLSDVLFDYAVSDLKPEALQTLASIAAKLSEVGSLEVVGHTDDVGSVAFNSVLGQARADTVRDWLVSGGHMEEARVTAVSAGELEPIVPNENADSRAQNRRVAFRIMEEES